MQKTRAIIILISLITIANCRQKQTEWQKYQAVRLDTLALITSTMPKQLKYTLPELQEMQQTITDDIELLKHANASKIDKVENAYSNQYLQLLTLGQKIIPEYKNAISTMEECVLLYKQFKQSIENKDYDQNTEAFKKEYHFLKTNFTAKATKIEDIGSLTSHFHVSFLRLQPKIEDLILKSVDEHNLPAE